MFCDLVGSTALSARLDPEEMGAVIRAYQDAVAGDVDALRGPCRQVSWATACWPISAGPRRTRTTPSGRCAPGSAGRGGRASSAPCGRALQARVGIATGLVVVGDLIGEGEAQERGGRRRDAEPGGAAAGARRAGQRGDGRARGGWWAACSSSPISARSTSRASPSRCRPGGSLGEGRAESRFEALHASGLTPLVGREEELALLLRPLAPGQGRRRPGRAALRRARHRQVAPRPGPARAARAASPTRRAQPFCSPYHTNSALYPVIAQLERAAGFAPRRPAEAQLDKLEALLAPGDQRSQRGRAAARGRCSASRSANAIRRSNLTPQQRKKQDARGTARAGRGPGGRGSRC